MASTTKSKIANIIAKGIWLSCFFYVLYQGVNLILKYHSQPYVTNLSHENARKFGYPTITVCAGNTEVNNCEDCKNIYNSTVLGRCNISSNTQYYLEANFVGNCSDPEQLFEESVFKAESVFPGFEPSGEFFRLTLQNGEKIQSSETQSIDHAIFGRCFSIFLNESIISQGKKNK